MRARGEGSTCWESKEMMWKVVSVSSCHCVMLCFLAFPIPVAVVSSCESEFVCHTCEPQRFISQTEEHSCSENSTPTSCSDNGFGQRWRLVRILRLGSSCCEKGISRVGDSHAT